MTRTDARGAKNALTAALVIYVGTFAALWPAERLLGAAQVEADELAHQLLTSAAFTCVGLLAVWRLGRGSLRESFGRRSSFAQLALGALLGAAILGFNLGFLTILSWLQDSNSELSLGLRANLVTQLLATALLPALFEEWLCRGVLWIALRRLTDARMTILLTAILFSLLHGLNGAGLLELPTRFVLGLGVGWLRHRTGSLGASVACHFANNALALAFI